MLPYSHLHSWPVLYYCPLSCWTLQSHEFLMMDIVTVGLGYCLSALSLALIPAREAKMPQWEEIRPEGVTAKGLAWLSSCQYNIQISTFLFEINKNTARGFGNHCSREGHHHHPRRTTMSAAIAGKTTSRNQCQWNAKLEVKKKNQWHVLEFWRSGKC